MSSPPTYCIDSSSLFEAWNRSYRPNSFPSFWVKFEQLIGDGRCVICEEVRTEVEDDFNQLFGWVKIQTGFVVEFDWNQEQVVKRVMREYPKLVNLKKNKGWADAFVIALALCGGHTVVTEETLGAANGPKIPYVCRQYGIPCIKIADMIENEGWRM